MMLSLDSTDDPKYVSTGTNPPDSDADQHSYDNQGMSKVMLLNSH